MPRDYSKPPRSGGKPPAGRPARGGTDKPPFGKFAKKPYQRREGGAEGERDTRGPSRPYGDKREGGGYRKPFSGPPREGGGYRKPYGEGREGGGYAPRSFGGDRGGSRPPMRRPQDDELFTATGKVAEIVGEEPQSRYDMLRKLWDFFRDERLVNPAGRRPRPSAAAWRSDRPEPRRPAEGDERPPRRVERKPAGDHPTARKTREIEAVPRRKYKETRDKPDERETPEE